MEVDQKLSQLVEDLTTSGEPQLDPKKIKELKKICKSSNEHISHVYHLLMTQLNQEHAEIRLSAFQVVDELFTRSHQFRTLIISNFQEFLELTVETDHEQPLPPPSEVAQKLKKAAIKSVQEWHEKYGEAYKKISLGYHFLKQNKKVDFQDVSARTLAERKRDEEKQKRLDSIYKDRAKKAEKEMEDMSQEIQAVLTEMENGFRLLMPDPFDFMVNDTEAVASRTAEVDKSVPCMSEQMTDQQAPFLEQMDDEQPCCSKDLPSMSLTPHTDRRDSAPEKLEKPGNDNCLESELASHDDKDYANFVQTHGLGSHKYTLNLEISTDVRVHENEDNAAIINNVMDAYKLIKNKFLPSVQSWIQLFTRAGINDNRLRQAIDLKNKLEAAMKKHKEMNIDYKEKIRRVVKTLDDDDDDDEDDEFVEVPDKEGYEPYIPDHLRKEYGLEPASPPKTLAAGRTEKIAGKMSSRTQNKKNEEELDPTCAAATWKIIQHKLPQLKPPDTSDAEPQTSGESNTKHKEEKAKAPVVPFGLDLFYWGQEQPTSGKILKFSSQHRFWAPNEMEEEVENKEIAGMLKSRYITFAGKFEPVTHKCRAPMPNGGLCERQDRYKCPFHGKIVPRDESGIPVNQEDRDREAKQKFEKMEEQPEWRDPEFMREVEAATGVDLGSARYSGKGKGGKGKKKKKKYPNLTDLKQQTNTSRSRLGKKIFDKTAMKRVVKEMNRMDQRKHEKFANQFNYALN